MMTMRRKLANDPYIRALDMRVYPASPRSMIVVGGSVPHEVFAFNNRLKCDCTAGQYGQFCAHVAAILHLKSESENGEKMSFAIDRTINVQKTPVFLPKRTKLAYGGIFAGLNVFDGEHGPGVVLKAIVTHSATARSYEKLDHITEGVAFGNNKWSFSDKYISPLMLIAHALTDLPYEKLYEIGQTGDDIKRILNECVGTGFIFAASVEEHKKQKGKFSNIIDKDSFAPADAAFAPIAAKMSGKIETKTSDKGFVYISSPRPVYQEDLEPAQGAADIDTTIPSDEIPF